MLALGGGRLVAGETPGCARGNGTPLRYSADDGKTWRDAAGPGGGQLLATPWLARGAELYALGCAGGFVSTDSGASFKPVAALSVQNYDPRDLALSPDGATAYLAATSEGGTLRVVRAERRGADWTGQTTVATGQGLAALAVAPDGRVALGGAEGVRVSTDRGATWRPLGEKLVANDLAFVGPRLYAATDAGLYLLQETWTRLPAPAGRVLRLVPAADALYAVTPDGVFRSS